MGVQAGRTPTARTTNPEQEWGTCLGPESRRQNQGKLRPSEGKTFTQGGPGAGREGGRQLI